MYTITLNDGTKIEGLTFERNILFSDNAIEAGYFRGKLAPATISNDEGKSDYDDGITGIHAHMEICYVKEMDGKFALALADIPEERYADARRDANIAYIAMMTGIDL